MPNRVVTNQTAWRLAKIVVIGMAVQILVIAYVLYQSYQGRVDLIKAQQGGCERTKLDRADNAKGWRIAEAARRAEGQNDVADRYAAIATSLEARSALSCKKAFPNASLFPTATRFP